MPERRPLSGLSVAITGAGSGIGASTARAAAAAGARVAAGDIDLDAVAAVASAAVGGTIAPLQLDVRDADSFASFLDAAEAAHGPLQVLVNNAGVDWMGPFHEEPLAATRTEIDVNLLGTIIGTRLALQRMLPRGGGHVVNVASGVGRVPLPWSAVYAATKHGRVGLTESLRMEYRSSPIRFSLIEPSQVDTPMLAGQARPRMLALVSPEEVARAILDAVERDRFEVWVPASQGITAGLGRMLPRPVREALMRALGVGRIAGAADLQERRAYHERRFGV